MPNFQSTTVIGHIGRDPELKYVGEKNTPVCKFSVAVNNPFKKDEPANWYNITVWRRAEQTAGMLQKGAAVVVSGSLWVREYNKKDGTRAYSLDLEADRWGFASAKGEATRQPMSNDQAHDGDDLAF